MPYTLKPNQLHIKDPESEGFLPQNVVADAATKDQVAAVRLEGGNQVAAVQEKGEETLASIPADYAALSGDVEDIQSALAAKLPDPPAEDGTYVLTVTVTGGEAVYAWTSAE